MRVLIHWVLTALAIWIVSRLVPGFEVNGAMSALIAAVVMPDNRTRGYLEDGNEPVQSI